MAFNTQDVYFFGNSIYLLTDSDTTWGLAQAEAQALGGNLATVNNDAEQTFLAGLFAGQNVWIGLNDLGTEGQFTWISGEPVTYTNWRSGEPNNLSNIQHYVAIEANTRWVDLRGDGAFNVTYQGVVEITAPTTPTIVIDDVDVIEPYGGISEAILTVRVLGRFTNPILLTYSTSDGTAIANSDYTPIVGGTLTFNPSVETLQTQQIRVPVRGDSDNVTRESFFVNLNQPPQAILARSQAEVTIRERSEVFTFGGDSAYVITATDDKWGTVREESRRLGGDLVIINNAQEQANLSGLIGTSNKWIGLTDAGEEDTFKWVDGTSVSYDNWESNEPNNLSDLQHFVALSTTSRWIDVRGDGGFNVEYQGIAEFPLSRLTVYNPLQTPVYRFFNTIAGGHFFTVSEEERDIVINSLPEYRYEGAGMRASNVSGENLVPVYRFFNTIAGGHFFTTSVEERDIVINNLPEYRYEEIGFYTYGAETNLGADVYRFFNTQAGGHFFTTSVAERDTVINTLPQYRYENIGFEAAFA